MTNDEVSNVFFNCFSGLMEPDDFQRRIIIADNAYAPADLQWLLDSIRTDPILSMSSYLEDTFDCDDYVFYLKTKVSLFSRAQQSPEPQAVGLLLTKRHAFNLCINAASQVWLINTQSDQRATTNVIDEFNQFLDLDGNNNPIQLIYI